MKIVFVHRAYESLAIEQLSACLKAAGHEVTLVFDPARFDDDFISVPWLARRLMPDAVMVDRVLAHKPDVVAFSVMTPTAAWATRITQAIKARSSVPVVWGGIHPTLCPEECLQFASGVFIGEAEGAWNKYLSFGGTFFGANTPDLNALPFPDVALFHAAAPWMANRYYIMTGRGCPFSCSFCYNSTIKNKREYIRRRSPEHVINELSFQATKAKYVLFGDDTFASDVDWLRDFSFLYKRVVRKPFACAVHPVHMTAEVAAILADMGCTDVEIGVQSWNAWVRSAILNRHETNETILNAAKAVTNSGMRLILDHIGGLPGETFISYDLSLQAYSQMKPSHVAFFWLEKYPGCKITADHPGPTPRQWPGFELLFALIPVLPLSWLRLAVRLGAHRVRWPKAAHFAAQFLRCLRFWNFKPIFRQLGRYL